MIKVVHNAVNETLNLFQHISEDLYLGCLLRKTGGQHYLIYLRQLFWTRNLSLSKEGFSSTKKKHGRTGARCHRSDRMQWRYIGSGRHHLSAHGLSIRSS